MLSEEKYFQNDLVNEALTSEPEFSLPTDFAEKVVIKVERKFEWNSYIKEFLIYLAVIVGIIAISVGISFIWYGASIESWTQFLLENLAMIIGINLIVLFILFIDRVLLRYFLYKSTVKNKH